MNSHRAGGQPPSCCVWKNLSIQNERSADERNATEVRSILFMQTLGKNEEKCGRKTAPDETSDFVHNIKLLNV